MYRFGQLLPALARGAELRNSPLLGNATLGIEVTEPALAARCGLGNIDPQHDGSGSELSAIEAALAWPLPPAGAWLVTIRPDLDAIGAMALLGLRAEGRAITSPMRGRIADVGLVDCFAWGRWPGARPMPTCLDDILEDVGGRDTDVLAGAMRDAGRELSDRVTIARTWLLSGTAPAAYLEAPRERAAVLWRGLRDGRIVMREAVPDRLVEVISDIDGALQLGYRIAPVVVTLNPHFVFPDGSTGRKYTIAQYQIGAVDLSRVAATLSELEPGWSGQMTIVGSPQGQASRLHLPLVSSAAVAALV